MSQQEQFQSDNRSTSEVEKESLDLIEKILKSNGYIVNDKGLNIEFAALKEIRNWVEQDDKTTQLNWDKVENCFAIMLNEYLDKTNDLKSKIGDCSDRRKSLIEKNINLEVEAVRPILLNTYLPIKSNPYLKFSRCLFIASIGNPEPKYKGTRHNVGHRLMDQLIEIYWKDHLYKQGFYYYSKKYPNLILFKSDNSFMNLQGKPIQKHFQQFHKTSNLIILHDELEQPIGKYQIRKPGTSSRGHNGLKSIDGFFRNKYTKIGIGIDKPKSKSISDYVLSKFDPKQLEVIDFDVLPNVVKDLEKMIELDLASFKQNENEEKPKSNQESN
ncbi:uncharacterized protein KGF55_004465 [Candida pseudojiufengensis]|uniref:uncharacterized protein n=1 Tax=Candida pseudojiufengensis TaxID=497109 RepID=UPI002224F3A6|nr:uncharacterized protein KGF55_004465 [Candida pseudojiufengensis]KAI5960572.1 hypothetical protein KGF55_004465 [Candida pseudojiufengensis]